MNGLSTRTPENSSNPTSIDKKMTTSRIVGSHAFSSSRKALTRVNVTTGTIREEAALIVAEGTIDPGRHTASPGSAPSSTSRPGSAAQMAGGARKSVGSGKRVSVRVEPGGPVYIKNKNEHVIR